MQFCFVFSFFFSFNPFMVAQEKALWELEKVSLHRRGDYKICYWILTFKIHFPLFSSSPDLHWPFLHVLCEGRAEHLECSWELKAKLTRPSSWDSSYNEGLRHRTCVIEIALRVKVSYLRQGQLWHSWVFWGKPARSLASSGLGPHVVIWGPAFFQWRGSARPLSGLTEKEKTKEDLNFSPASFPHSTWAQHVGYFLGSGLQIGSAKNLTWALTLKLALPVLRGMEWWSPPHPTSKRPGQEGAGKIRGPPNLEKHAQPGCRLPGTSEKKEAFGGSWMKMCPK